MAGAVTVTAGAVTVTLTISVTVTILPLLDGECVGTAPGRPVRVGIASVVEPEGLGLPKGARLAEGRVLKETGGPLPWVGLEGVPVGAGTSPLEPPPESPEVTAPISRFNGKSLKRAVRDLKSERAVETASCWFKANLARADGASAAIATRGAAASISMQVL